MPGYVAFEPRFAAEVEGIFLAIFGLEERGPDLAGIGARLMATLVAPGGPAILESGTVRPGFGAPGQIWFAYWRSRGDYEQWCARADVAALWADDSLLVGDVGLWREEAWISLDHNETSYSRDADLTGLGQLGDGLAETEVHGYWGSARDRITAAATSDLAAATSDSIRPSDGLGRRILVTAPPNLCLIRTSQDLNRASPEQLEVYHQEVAPTLFAGLEFLRKSGEESGCLGMRLVDEVDLEGRGLQRTCGVGFFRSLGNLEQWTHHHPTHGAIMASFIGMVQRFNGEPGLHLWHEITVFPAGSLHAEYINCTGDGGLIAIGTHA